MRSWLTPLRRQLAALNALVRPVRRPAGAPRTPRLQLSELERRELLTATADLIPQNYPGYESDYLTPWGPYGAGSPAGCYAAICIGHNEYPPTVSGSIDWATVDGTARAGQDYVAASGTVTFSAGVDPWQYVFVPLIDDARPEFTETFTIRLSNPTGGVSGGGDYTVTILDDDWGNLSPIPQSLACAPCPVGSLIGAAGSIAGGVAVTGQELAPRAYSANPVRYADGVLAYGANDLGGGTALGWGLQRSWTNGAGYAPHPDAGNGWALTQFPSLVQQADGYDDTLIVVANGGTAYFYDLTGTSYSARWSDTSVLEHDAANHVFTLTDAGGARVTFYDFSSTWAAGQRGRFAGFTDAAGTTVAVVSSDGSGRPTEVQQAVTVGGTATTDSYVFSYSGSGAGALDSVALRRRVGAGGWSAVRSVEYDYYDGVESYGTAGDLKTATVKDAGGSAVSVDYYRYYTSGESNGYPGALKTVVAQEGYARAAADLGPVESATDAQLAAYAAYAFRYDGAGRVAQETVGGAGCSVCSSGQGTITYAYTTSGNADGFNSWATKTVETRPDGSVLTVYTNAFAEVLLTALSSGSGPVLRNYYRYDGSGRLVLTADPVAVTGYSDGYADLVQFVGGNASYLSDSAGLVTAYTYGAATTATGSTAGDARGYLKAVEVRQGETGTAVPQQSQTYFKNTVSGIDFFQLAAQTQYRNDDGTGGQTTSYGYTFLSGTNQIASTTVTLPTVTTAQNGSNGATTVTVVNDAFGRPVWAKDQGGFISYTAYDATTGAVAKTITDVDTTQTATFANLPSGWATPSGAGLHLTTAYESDALGRATKVTYPNGRVDYTVYNDAAHEVRAYAGWDATANRPTGPTTVARADWARGYTEELTMSAAPSVSGGRPTGAEGVAQVQSLSRGYTNAVGQVIYTDAYFSLSGLTYSTSTTLGTEGVNFLRTRYQYDDTGAVKRVQTPEGTVTRYVRDGIGRVVGEWVGTDDTPTSGYWSPTNTAGTNLVKVREYEYDGGGVGDGNLTKVTEYPGGGAAARVTRTWFDWRNRAVAVKQGVETSESTSVNRPLVYADYDNLGQVTKTRVYDADGVTPTVTGGVPQPLSSGLLRAQSTTSYDELGRAYRTDTYSVDPSTGSVGSYTLYAQTWYDGRGNVVKTLSPGGLVRKAVYDGAGRVVTSFTTDGGGDAGYADAGTVTGDIVLEQAEYSYDASGNVLSVTTRERNHDATGTGTIGAPSGIASRNSFAGFYYDLADRPTASVDVGTNGGPSWTRPGTAPSGSATVLVTQTRYATDAVQDVALTGAPTGGTFTLSFGGYTTSALAYNASAATVQAALAGLASVGSGNVAVSAAPSGSGWEVRFTGALAAKYQTALTASGAGLTGGTSPGVAVATVNAGGDAGMAAETTDTAGRVHRTYADALGRTTRSIQNFVDGVVSDGDDKSVGYAYNGAGLTSLTAYLTGGGGQTTAYVFGTTVAGGSTVESNDVAARTQWPDASTGAASVTEQEVVTFNALGQVLTGTDRNGTVHTLSYDVLGRVVSDAVTTLGSGVDGAVRRVETAYDGQGNAYLVTSYDAASGGSVVNQVQRAFNGLGQMTTEWQAHGGAVNTSTSPKVQYAFSEMASGADHSRLTSVTYPSGYVLTYNYASGLNGDISRLSSLSDSTGTVESYDYLGLSTVVRRAHPQPNVDLSYVARSGEGAGDAGDQYTGLDRFGRVVDQRWLNPTSGTATDRFQYGYDAAGNRTFRDNLASTGFGEVYTYDGLDQLAGFARGTLNGTKTGISGTVARSQGWDYDAVGNFDSVTTNGAAQARTANAQNEVTGIAGATTPTYDSNGNMTGDETGRRFVFDAWNRLVAVKSAGGTTLKTYAYDGLSRRVSETATGATTDLFYSAAWQVLEEKVGSNTSARYVWSPVYVDALILRDRDTDANGTLDERLWVQQDANWNVTVLVNGSGSVVERYAYDAFGVRAVYDSSWSVRSGGSSYALQYGHQGLRFDETVGQYDNFRRWYSPSLGRFTSIDPLRFWAKDVNLYRVEGNGPTNRLDPSGLDWKVGLKPVDPKRPIEACPDNNNKMVGTIDGKNGTVLQVWVIDTAFAGRLIDGGDGKPVGFGKCLPVGGYNLWWYTQDKDGMVTDIIWYNIGPNIVKNKLADVRKHLDTAPGKTDDALQSAVAKNYLTVLPANAPNTVYKGFDALETVCYTMNTTAKGKILNVQRLYVEVATGKIEWKQDPRTKLGPDLKVFPDKP